MKKYGIFEKHVVLGTILVDMYGKCGDLVKAQELFDELPSRNVRTWNVLIAGYVQHGYFENALKCFRQMKEEKGVYPNAATFSCILKACGSLGTLEMGKEIHEEITEKNLLKDNVVLGTALVDMYAKCGSLEKAQEVFQELPRENIIAWNAMIAGYAKHGFGDKALEYFRKMQSLGLHPDAVTFICILKVCSNIGALKLGEEIHADVGKQESLCKDVVLGTSLVNMYVKCGMPEKALEVFNNLPLWNVVSWNVLLSGYAQLGQATMVWMLFSRMLAQDVMPNLVTFLVLLITCNHAGLVEEGQRVFDDIYWVCKLSPEIVHYSCMADLLGRAGQFENSILTIERVQPSDRLPLWVAFLGACCTALNMELGMWAFERCVQLDEKCTAAYVYMGNLYATASMRTK
jgi:pentatricopeptide repeat protein